MKKENPIETGMNNPSNVMNAIVATLLVPNR